MLFVHICEFIQCYLCTFEVVDMCAHVHLHLTTQLEMRRSGICEIEVQYIVRRSGQIYVHILVLHVNMCRGTQFVQYLCT